MAKMTPAEARTTTDPKRLKRALKGDHEVCLAVMENPAVLPEQAAAAAANWVISGSAPQRLAFANALVARGEQDPTSLISKLGFEHACRAGGHLPEVVEHVRRRVLCETYPQHAVHHLTYLEVVPATLVFAVLDRLASDRDSDHFDSAVTALRGVISKVHDRSALDALLNFPDAGVVSAALANPHADPDWDSIPLVVVPHEALARFMAPLDRESRAKVQAALRSGDPGVTLGSVLGSSEVQPALERVANARAALAALTPLLTSADAEAVRTTANELLAGLEERAGSLRSLEAALGALSGDVATEVERVAASVRVEVTERTRELERLVAAAASLVVPTASASSLAVDAVEVASLTRKEAALALESA